MISRALTVLLSLFGAGWLGAQGGLRWGEFGPYSNWERCGWEIDSKYEFLGTLPDLTQFPRLLEVALNPKFNEKERTIIFSQMRTLSRCDFEKDQDGRLKVEVRRQKAVEAWQEWWERYGRELSEDLPRTGKPHAEAWKVVAPTPYLECPKYPVSIPRTWSTKITLKTGDYGGYTEERIEFDVDGDNCHLTRQYFTGWPGRVPWTHEVWKDLTRKEADLFYAAVIYGVDNPWFFMRDEFSSDGYKKDGKLVGVGVINGRPENWTAYYASVRWTGFLDAGGKVMINRDPWSWDAIHLHPGEDSMLEEVIGPVFRILTDMFPDPSWDEERSRWKRVPQGEDDAAQIGKEAVPAK